MTTRLRWDAIDANEQSGRRSRWWKRVAGGKGRWWVHAWTDAASTGGEFSPDRARNLPFFVEATEPASHRHWPMTIS